jgi:RNA polymerase sigma-70 factor (ECF subfamily)
MIESPSSPGEAASALPRFERLYRTSRDDVFAYVMSLLRDPAAAEDVTALAFERALRRRRSFDRRRGEERAWLFGIARNAALDELRRRRRHVALLAERADERVAEDERAAEEETDLALRRATVKAALAAMTPRERDLIALKYHGGLTNGELAAVLGVSESNAGTMLHRTMTKLRRACDESA